MKFTKAATAIFILLLIFYKQVSAQCMVMPVSLEKKVQFSSSIALGKVSHKQSYIDAATGYVYTRNTVTVSAWLKNASSVSEVEVITLGGVVGNSATLASPSLELNLGNEYIFFLEGNNLKNDDKKLRLQNPGTMQTMVYADLQGAVRNDGNNYRELFARNAESESSFFSKITRLARSKVVTPAGREFAARRAVNTSTSNAKINSLDSFSPTTTNGGTIVPGDFITITGSGFGATAGSVAFKNANDGGATYITSGVASDIVSWSDASITVKVPEDAGTGTIRVIGASTFTSATTLTVGYTHTSVNSSFAGFPGVIRQRSYLRNLNGSGGYTFLFNTAFNANTSAVNAFTRAINTWVCASGINFRTGGSTASVAANDNSNVVVFDAALPAGVLGQAVSNYIGNATGGCNGTNTVWWVNDIDVRFKPDPPITGRPWQYGPSAATASQYDFESVAVHELGHALGLGHRIAPGAVMHYAIANGANIRTPDATEISGATAKLSYSSVATCFNPTGSGSEMLSAGCSLPVNFISFSGERRDKVVNDLQWVASQSTNNTGYSIERSADGNAFNQISFLAEANPSPNQQTYFFSDTKAGIYPWYYRLKQIDQDGKYTYSKVIFIKGDNNSNWRVFSSPDGSTLNLYGNLNVGKNIQLQVMNAAGQVLLTKPITNTVSAVNTSSLSKGVYYYKLIDKSKTVLLSGSLLLGQ